MTSLDRVGTSSLRDSYTFSMVKTAGEIGETLSGFTALHLHLHCCAL